MSEAVQSVRRTFEQLSGRRQAAVAEVDGLEVKQKALATEHEELRESQAILQSVAQATQKELEYHVGEPVALAMASVFPDPYTFHIDFETKNNRSVACISFGREGSDERIDPLRSSGGGPIDVTVFGLRVSLWSLEKPRSSPVILMDEPFRYVSRDLQVLASMMLKEISRRFGLQFVLVTHEVTLVEQADKVFENTIRHRISEVKEVVV